MELVIILIASIYGTKENKGRSFTLLDLFLLFIFNLLLTYHLTEKETRTVVRRYLFNVFGIEENNHMETWRLGSRPSETNSENIPQFTLRETDMTASSTTNNRLTNSTVINVLPLRRDAEDA